MLVVAAVMLPSVSFAQTTSIDSLLAQLKTLQAQILELQKKKGEIEKQQKELKTQTKALEKQGKEQAAQLVRQLREGSEGDDVRVLQAMLAADPDIYPEGVISGFFGKKTAQAVKRFQKKHGLFQAGAVGPQTLRELQKLLGKHQLVIVNNGNGTTTSQLCTLVKPEQFFKGWNKKYKDHDDDDGDDDSENRNRLIPICKTVSGDWWNNIFPGGAPTTTPIVDITAPMLSTIASSNVTTSGATITWTTNESATTQVEYGTTASYGSMTMINAALLTTHSAALTGLASNTTYHFRVLSKDAANNLATSGDLTFTTGAVDADAPVLSSIVAANLTTSGATITWTTNENATTQVDYGTTASYGSSSTLDSTLASGHTVVLTGLSASTLYHFRVNSKDASNNLSTSGDMTFTTLSPVDATAPIISGAAVSSVATTTATISWSTSEAATGKVYYGTVNPLVLGSATNVENVSLAVGHSFGLTGLTASTTYYYVLESKDALNNTATSTQGSFVTTD